MITDKEIKSRIEEVEELIKQTHLDLITSDFFLNLFKIHDSLWDMLYFKKNLEKDFLKPPKKEKETKEKKEVPKNTIDLNELMGGLLQGMGDMPNPGNKKNEDPNN